MVGINLNQPMFKALSSDIRVTILQTLDSRQMTLSELSRQLEVNKNTLYPHLTMLADAGLIKRKERKGHKWVYYKLTWSGSSILHPETSKIFLSLSILILALYSFFSIIFIFISSFIGVEQSTSGPGDGPGGLSPSIFSLNVFQFSLVLVFVIILLFMVYFGVKYYKTKKLNYIIKNKILK